MPTRRHERPLKRKNPSGIYRWVARYTNRAGKRVSAGTFDTRREAQEAINAAYGAPDSAETVRGYAKGWLHRHPRSDASDRTYEGRLHAHLETPVDGTPIGDWRLTNIRRRHVNDLIAHILGKGRSRNTALGVLQTFSAMWNDAMDDEVAESNPWHGVRIRSKDPRIQTPPREIHVYEWAQMHAVSTAAPGVYGPAMIRALSDCGLRLTEMLTLERANVFAGACGVLTCRAKSTPHLHVDGKTGPRAVPLTAELAGMLAALPPRLDTRLMFPTEHGRALDRRAFYDKVWAPARKAVPGMEQARPHEFRHTWVSRMRAQGFNPAALAAVAGHSEKTATTVYTHAVDIDYDGMRGGVG